MEELELTFGDDITYHLICLENPTSIVFKDRIIRRSEDEIWLPESLAILVGLGNTLTDLENLSMERLDELVWNCVISSDLETMERIIDNMGDVVNHIKFSIHGYGMVTERVDIELVEDLFVRYSVNFWDYYLSWAAFFDNLEMVIYLIDKKGAKSWREGMRGAISGNSPNMVKFFEDLGYNNWHICIEFAMVSDRKNMLKYFVEKLDNATDLNIYSLIAAHLGLDDTVEFIHHLEEEKMMR